MTFGWINILELRDRILSNSKVKVGNGGRTILGRCVDRWKFFS